MRKIIQKLAIKFFRWAYGLSKTQRKETANE